MAGQVVVRVVMGPADVTLVCDDVGYSPDVIDDMRVRALDTVHSALHMRECGDGPPEGPVLEDFLARMLEDDDGGC